MDINVESLRSTPETHRIEACQSCFNFLKFKLKKRRHLKNLIHFFFEHLLRVRNWTEHYVEQDLLPLPQLEEMNKRIGDWNGLSQGSFPEAELL